MNAREAHHRFNLVYIGLIAAWTTYNWLSLQHCQDLAPYVLFVSLYYVLDSIFIIVWPESVGAPITIVLHHVMSLFATFGLAYNFCWVRYVMVETTLVDVNTWLLIVRQFLKSKHVIVEIAFFITWISIRILLYPYLMFKSFKLVTGSPLYLDQMENMKQAEEMDINVQITVSILFILFNILNFKWSYDLFKKTIQGRGNKDHDL